MTFMQEFLNVFPLATWLFTCFVSFLEFLDSTVHIDAKLSSNIKAFGGLGIKGNNYAKMFWNSSFLSKVYFFWLYIQGSVEA